MGQAKHKQINHASVTTSGARTWVAVEARTHHKGWLKMDTTRPKKTCEAKNHLAQNRDTRAETVQNLSWGDAQHTARGIEWRVLIEALCPIGDEEE